MSRQATVIRLAPAPPPCFATRDIWLEFLGSAAEETQRGRLGPVDMRQSPAKFNRNFDFCDSCPAKHALAMNAQGRCQPDYLRTAQAESAHAVGTES